MKNIIITTLLVLTLTACAVKKEQPINPTNRNVKVKVISKPVKSPCKVSK